MKGILKLRVSANMKFVLLNKLEKNIVGNTKEDTKEDTR